MCVCSGLIATSPDDLILLEEAITSLRDDDVQAGDASAAVAADITQEKTDEGNTPAANAGDDGKSGSDDGGEKSKTPAQNSKAKMTKKVVHTNEDGRKSKPAKKSSKSSKKKSRKLLASTSVISDDEILSSSASGSDDDESSSSSDSENDVMIYLILYNKIYLYIIFIKLLTYFLDTRSEEEKKTG